MLISRLVVIYAPVRLTECLCTAYSWRNEVSLSKKSYKQFHVKNDISHFKSLIILCHHVESKVDELVTVERKAH